VNPELHQRADDDARIHDGLDDPSPYAFPLFLAEHRGEHLLLARVEPPSRRGPIGQPAGDDDTEDDGRDPLDDDEPFPAGEPESSVELEQEAGQRRPEHGREW